jgi:KaiC/GvpD/RAD55 family RecA-like ATPase
MIISELVQRSPLRVFEKSIHGGLKVGEVGVIASPSGIGKTSVLVQIALDKLLQEKKVIHVSFTQHTGYVLAWYEDIFDEFIKKKNLENIREVKDEIVKNRVLMNFSQDGVTGDQVLRSLRAMIVEGGFKAECLIIDGFDFSRMDRERISKVKDFAKELDLEVWYSCTVPAENDKAGFGLYTKQNIPVLLKDFVDLIDSVVVLEPKGDHIEFSVSKDRDVYNPPAMALKLDPKTLLIQG